jgi:hypothetical protein
MDPGSWAAKRPKMMARGKNDEGGAAQGIRRDLSGILISQRGP